MTKRVFVTGAGFTRAFYKNAPLILDDYDGATLRKDFRRFPAAMLVLEAELRRDAKRRINIERLMTRLDSGMPHDARGKRREELQLLLASVKAVFLKKINEAKADPANEDLLKKLAAHCVQHGINVITFNYDDTFDKALHTFDPYLRLRGKQLDVKGWGPTSGYGFPCRFSSESTFLSHNDHFKDVLLLKLHGSMNWFPRLGAQPPYAVSDILHKEPWFNVQQLTNIPLGMRYGPNTVLPELTAQSPFIVPPVLVKSALSLEPILGHIWSKAHDLLAEAEEVTFIGYSVPLTDIASGFLFMEALSRLPVERVQVVNLARTKKEKRALIESYRRFFPRIKEGQFHTSGALDWATQLLVAS